MKEKSILRRNLIKHLFNALILSFALVLLFLNTFGWFSIKKAARVNEIELNLYDEDIQVEYFVYMWNMDTKTGSDLDRNGQSISMYNINMHAYDLIFKAVNKYNPVVIRVAIKGSDMPAEGNAIVTIDRDTSKGIYSNNGGSTAALSEYTSSIIRITAATGAGYYAINPQGEADVPTIYDNVVNGDLDNGITGIKGNELIFDTKTFTKATVNGDTFSYSKLNALTFNIPYSQEDWNDTDGDSIADTLNIYLLMDYDIIDASETVPSLIELYCLGHDINSNQLSLSNKVYLSNDLLKIRADRFRGND